MPGRILNASCLCERTNRDIADIPPQGMGYFLVGEGNDVSNDGMFHSKILSKGAYERLLSDAEARNHIGFVLTPINAQYALLKNDSYKITVTAYADDTSPDERQFIINTKNKIELILVKRK